jgi:hypothetical protein
MSTSRLELGADRAPTATSGWRELWLKEDWWAVWLGLGIVIVGYALFANGASLKWIAVTPEKWSSLDQLGGHFAANGLRYLAQFVLWLAVFAAALTTLGFKAREFVPSFAFLYVFSVLIFALGPAQGYSLADYNKQVVPTLVGPIKDLRTWAFIFCFLSIGLTTRFRDLAGVGARPFAAFSVGVAVNVALGFILSVFVFAPHWANLAR